MEGEADYPWGLFDQEQDSLTRIAAYASHLNRNLESWEIDAILAVTEDHPE